MLQDCGRVLRCFVKIFRCVKCLPIVAIIIIILIIIHPMTGMINMTEKRLKRDVVLSYTIRIFNTTSGSREHSLSRVTSTKAKSQRKMIKGENGYLRFTQKPSSPPCAKGQSWCEQPHNYPHQRYITCDVTVYYINTCDVIIC